jgi:nitroimidazol reductase NimA-like FMN-containing flavoprotein (pyridoxamine 5'-phosphate oxidase superfamily)
MLKIKEMGRSEAVALLLRTGFGHLGCARDGRPYVVPMNFAYDGESLFFYTTEGTKTEFIGANHEVCFQVEEITDPLHWRSVVVTGRAERLTSVEDVERAMWLICERNPTLAPAVNRTKIGSWTRLNRVVLLRVRPADVSGMETAWAGGAAGSDQEARGLR